MNDFNSLSEYTRTVIKCHKLRNFSHYSENLFIFSVGSLNMSNRKKKVFIQKYSWKKMFFYNFRKSRRSVCISRWNGVIDFRDRCVEICEKDDDDGWISAGFGDDSIICNRLGLLLNKDIRYRISINIHFITIYLPRCPNSFGFRFDDRYILFHEHMMCFFLIIKINWNFL